MLSFGLLALAIATAAWFYLKPQYMLLVLMLTLPFQRVGSFPLDPVRGFPVIQPVQVVGLAVVLAIAALEIRSRRWQRLVLAIVPLVLVLVCGAIAATGVGYPQIWRDLVSAGFAVALCIAVALAVSHTRLRQLWFALCIVAAGTSLFGMYQFAGDIAGLPLAQTGLLGRYSHHVFGFPRIQSTMAEPLFYANFLLLPVFVGISVLLYRRGDRVLTAGVLGLVVINFMLTLSRGAFAASAVGLVVWAWLTRSELGPVLRRYWGKMLLGVVLLMVVTIGALAATSVVLDKDPLAAPKRFIELTTTHINDTGSVTDRFAVQKQALTVYRERPWFGLGIGGYSFHVAGYPATRTANDRVTINNEFIELLVEVGAVGFVAYLAFLALLLQRLWHARKHATGYHRVWLAGVLAVIVATLVQYQSFSGFFIYHIWALLGLGLGLAYLDGNDPAVPGLV